MEFIAQEFDLRLRYTVHFTEGVFESANPLLASAADGRGGEARRRLLCILDQGVHEHHRNLPDKVEAYCRARPQLEMVRPVVLMPGGERVKNSSHYVSRVHQLVSECGLCRHSCIVAIGGGALLDMAGYAAATAHRGIRLIRVPTTVLAQNDSGVGVKNGINAFGKKNFLGVFTPPHAVINDFLFLATLEDRDWRSGIAEAVKVALVKDADFFAFIERQAQDFRRRRAEPMRQLIRRCAALHLQHIASAGDPFETGCSRPLDFGHWAAHKLEQLTDFRLRHGEAVAIGMALDAMYSHLIGLLPAYDLCRILSLLGALGFSLFVPEMERPLRRSDPASLLHGLDEFREHLGGRLTIMLLAGIGRGIEVHEMQDEIVAASIAGLASFAAGVPAALTGGMA